MLSEIIFYGKCRRQKKNSGVFAKTLIMILSCTHVIRQKYPTFFLPSSSSKHHFSKFLSQLFNWRIKEGTIKIDCNIWKSVVFDTFICDYICVNNDAKLPVRIQLAELIHRMLFGTVVSNGVVTWNINTRKFLGQ